MNTNVNELHEESAAVRQRQAWRGLQREAARQTARDGVGACDALYELAVEHGAPAATAAGFAHHINGALALLDGQVVDGLAQQARTVDSGHSACQVNASTMADWPVLAAEHAGLRVSYSGLLTQARGALTRGQNDPGLAEMLRQLQGHLAELGRRWYAGDAAVVDEMLQLYCVEPVARMAAKDRQVAGATGSSGAVDLNEQG